MIKFNEETTNYLTTLHQIRSKSTDLEYEIRFGLPLRQFGGDKNIINQSKFTNLLRTLKHKSLGITHQSKLDILDIFVHENNSINASNKQYNLRFSIEGSSNIAKFCKTNTIYKHSSTGVQVPSNIIHKSTAIIPPSQTSLLDRLNTKGFNKLDSKKLTLDIEDYCIRFSMKNEIPYNYRTRKFNTSNNHLQRISKREFDEYLL